jgi:signal transduction histidine kinase
MSGRRSSLRLRVLLLVAVALLPALAILTYSTIEQRQEGERSAREEALRLAQLVAADNSRLVEGARQLLGAIAQFPPVRAAPAPGCDEALETLLAEFPSYGNFGVADANGDVVCSALPLASSVNVADRAYFRLAVQTRSFAVGEYQIGRITGRPGVNFGYPITEGTGRISRVVFAALDLGWLSGFVAQANLPPGAILTVVDANGTILARYPDGDGWIGRSETAPLVETATRLVRGTVDLEGSDGVRRTYAFAPLEGPPGQAVFAAIGLREDGVFGGPNRMFARNLLALAAVAVLALLAGRTAGSAFIVRPVGALVAATERVRAGDLSARSGASTGSGELDRLGRAFDVMASSLQERESALRWSASRLAVLHEIDTAILSVSPLERTFGLALEGLQRTGSFRAVAGVLVDPDTGELSVLDVAPRTEAAVAAGERLPPSAVEPFLSPSAREPFLIGDLRSQAESGAGLLERLRSAGVRSFAAVPLRSSGALGWVMLMSDQPDAVSAGDLEMASEVAAQLAIAVVQARLREAERTRRAELEGTVADLRRMDEQRQRLLSRLVTAQEEERKRVASDIHDDSIQAMTAASIRIETLGRGLSDPASADRLAVVRDSVSRAIGRLRRLLFELRPPALDREGLVPALREMLQQVAEDSGMLFRIGGELQVEPSEDLRATAYRIVQEAVANVRKHSEAREVEVRVATSDGGLLVEVRDDGKGFEVAEALGGQPGHLGLTSMRERAELAGGWLDIRSSQGRGTTLEFWLPVGEAAQPPAGTRHASGSDPGATDRRTA